MNTLRFIAKHRVSYLRFTFLGIGLVLTFATIQITLLYPNPTPRHLIVPLLLGTTVGLLLSTLIALRREVLDGQRMFRAVADLAQEFIYLRRVDGSYEYVSPSCEQLTGYSTADFYAQPSFMSKLVHPEDRQAWDRHVHQMDQLGQPEKLVIRIHTRNGEMRWIEHLCTDVRDAQGNIFGVRSTNLDISGRVDHEREMAIAAVAFETHEAILITDRDSRILRVNRAFCDITGYAADEVIGQTPALFRSGRHDAQFYAEMWTTLRTQGRWAGETWDRRKNGEIYPKYLSITAVPDQSGEVAYYVGTFSDITVRKDAEAEINRLAYYDPLTHLPNRRLLLDRLAHTMAASQRHGRHGAVLFIDLDHFKNLNDTRGHDVGDHLLIEVADRLISCVRAEDTVARLGGDEFVVLLEDLGDDAPQAAAQVEAAADKILCAINQPYLLKGYPHHSTSSIGAVLFKGQSENIDELLKHADVALYRAKDAGRATLRFFDPTMQAALDARAVLEADLREAVVKHQFHLHYQAQLDSAGHIIGAEALLRWQHPQRGSVPPVEFIPFAEECGLIVPIGRWVLQVACKQIKAWESHPLAKNLRLAVNVSASQFMQESFVEEAIQQIQINDLDPHRLKLELTESALIDGIDNAIEKMRALKTVGIGFSLDDFGTGYSSLSYLRRLPLDQLKIDRSFVSDIMTNASDAVIAQTIIGMARNLGLDVIAEGVETQDQFRFLDQHGCNGYQGYLFSRPLPLDEFEQLLKENDTSPQQK
ncbi:MAG: EAL domain-containing protein [Gammaproteobacteria bacterium]|nr:EAL domain-containing protein [Rhodocyclaceae bacterium]MBU3910586.1 EAL domain-containing protein [Gammaproteobacteria bacterium]MBU3989233.1 EAL domain-containing protein [Gammaproteobacteria bacterium]MBU4005067.1 EAL domain-containing protein [Gammaproteobacteria bacterium]MBU4020660.1 EAL domain-containing protein [Gammaproteobacteria bacterium]